MSTLLDVIKRNQNFDYERFSEDMSSLSKGECEVLLGNIQSEIIKGGNEEVLHNCRSMVLDRINNIEKAKSGVYADNSLNRKLGRVGQEWGRSRKAKEKLNLSDFQNKEHKELVKKVLDRAKTKNRVMIVGEGDNGMFFDYADDYYSGIDFRDVFATVYPDGTIKRGFVKQNSDSKKEFEKYKMPSKKVRDAAKKKEIAKTEQDTPQKIRDILRKKGYTPRRDGTWEHSDGMQAFPDKNGKWVTTTKVPGVRASVESLLW